MAAGVLFWKLRSWLRLQQLTLSQQGVPSPPPPSDAHKLRVPGTARKSGLTTRVDGGQEGRGDQLRHRLSCSGPRPGGTERGPGRWGHRVPAHRAPQRPA